MTYAISDIHGQYTLFEELLGKIGFTDNDTLFVLGDMIDRGPEPIKVLRKLMIMPNAFCILGNHELMAMNCRDFLLAGNLEEGFLNRLEHDEETGNTFSTWSFNGSYNTIKGLWALDKDDRQEIIDFICDLPLYETVSARDKDYLLVHAGLSNFSPDKSLDDYLPSEVVWDCPDYKMQYFSDLIYVSGHIPTQNIAENPKPGYIYKSNNNIAIDCGAFIKGGRLAALCLETGEEFYSSCNK